MDKLKTKISGSKARRVILHATILASSIVTTIFLVENNYAHQALHSQKTTIPF